MREALPDDGPSTTPAVPLRRAQEVSPRINRAVAVPPLAVRPAPLRTHATLPPVTPTPFRSKRTNRIQGEALLGIAYANQQFTANGVENEIFRTDRETYEQPEVSLQFTARVRYRLGERSQLIGGLTYAEIRNQFEYSLPGAPDRVRSNNRLRMLEIPLLYGYTFPGNRLRVGGAAGAVVNVLSSARGFYVDPFALDAQRLEESGYYRTNVGLGYMASLTTAYPIGKDRTTMLLIEPYFKAYPGSFTRNDAPLSEKYWTAGLQVGLRRTLK